MRFDDLSLCTYFLHGGQVWEKTDDGEAKRIVTGTRHGFNGYESVELLVLHIEEQWRGLWHAVTDDYDGPGSPIGHGATRHIALVELAETLETLEDM